MKLRSSFLLAAFALALLLLPCTAGAQSGIKIFPHHNAAGNLAACGQEAVKAKGRVKWNHLLFGKGDRCVSGIDGIARVLNLRHCSFAAGVENTHAADFLIGLARGLE